MDLKKRVLVVDDEEDFIQLIGIRLRASGYDVITATDGKTALVKIESERPDAVLLDILMPGMDGIEVLKEIRKKDKKIPVFIITAFSNDERFSAANKYGASGFIVKTNDLKKEVENITSVLTLSYKYKNNA